MSTPISIEALFAFLNADISQKRAMLEREPKLMEEGSALLLEEIAAAQTDPDMAEHARGHAALVRDCRLRGVAAVFDTIGLTQSGSENIDESDLSALLDRIEVLQHDPGSAAENARLCEIALGLVRENGRPDLWALLHGIRAMALRALGESDGDPELLRAAVADCDAAIETFARMGMQLDWAKTQANRAGALLGLGELAGDPACLHSALEACGAALEIFTPTANPGDWAMCLMNRGVALQRIGQSKGEVETLNAAVAELDAALDIFDPTTSPGEWAMAQMNRAVALLSLGDLDGNAATLKDSISGFESAGEVFTQESDLVMWARTRQNRANALMRLSELGGDPAAARASVADYDLALDALSPKDSRSDWGLACLNRAGAHLLLHNLEGDAQSLADALSGFDAALEIFNRKDAQSYWAGIHHNRANALVRRGQDTGDPSLLRDAVAGFDLVLEVTDRKAAPIEWAGARASRGLAMRALGRLTGNAELLRSAAADCVAALEVIDREAHPASWATAQQNNADALVDLGNLTGDTSLLRQAVAAYNTALEVLTMDVHPDQSMEVTSVLVRQLFLLGEFDAVRDHLDAALVGGLRHLLAISNRAARERAVQQAAGLAELRAWIAIALDKDGAGALLWLERARGQLLTLALSEDPQRAFEMDGADLGALLDAIPAGGAAVLPIISPAGARVAVIPSGRNAVDVDDFLDLPALTHDLIVEWFYGARGHASVGGYLHAYDVNRGGWSNAADGADGRKGRAFPEVLHMTLGLIWQHLLGPVEGRLRQLAVTPDASVVIVPTGLLSTLPLWAAASDLVSEPFGARWTTSISPSLGVLAVVQRRGVEWLTHGAPLSMLAVLDPATDGQSRLAGAVLEGGILAHAVMSERLLRLSGEEATASAVLAELAGRTHLHFAAHGFYAPTVPSLSAVCLAGSDRLTLGELQTLSAIDHLRLVVLSACYTALPGLERGRADEFIGLPAGFIQAGAAAVLASHWPVRDDATFFLMWKFYDEYLDGRGRVVGAPAEALRSASLWLRSVTCKDLEALFEPMRGRQGNAIHRTIDRSRPKGRRVQDIEGIEDAGIAPAPSPSRVVSFDVWQRFRRVEAVESSSTTTDQHAADGLTPDAYFLGDEEGEWELSRPFADPVHWAAFSITGI